MVGLKKILGIPQMPPDIGIAHSATRHHKFERDNEKRQNQEERRPLTQPKANFFVGRLREKIRGNLPANVVDLGLALE